MHLITFVVLATCFSYSLLAPTSTSLSEKNYFSLTENISLGKKKTILFNLSPSETEAVLTITKEEKDGLEKGGYYSHVIVPEEIEFLDKNRQATLKAFLNKIFEKDCFKNPFAPPENLDTNKVDQVRYLFCTVTFNPITTLDDQWKVHNTFIDKYLGQFLNNYKRKNPYFFYADIPVESGLVLRAKVMANFVSPQLS